MPQETRHTAGGRSEAEGTVKQSGVRGFPLHRPHQLFLLYQRNDSESWLARYGMTINSNLRSNINLRWDLCWLEPWHADHFQVLQYG